MEKTIRRLAYLVKVLKREGKFRKAHRLEKHAEYLSEQFNVDYRIFRFYLHAVR